MNTFLFTINVVFELIVFIFAVEITSFRVRASCKYEK